MFGRPVWLFELSSHTWSFIQAQQRVGEWNEEDDNWFMSLWPHVLWKLLPEVMIIIIQFNSTKVKSNLLGVWPKCINPNWNEGMFWILKFPLDFERHSIVNTMRTLPPPTVQYNYIASGVTHSIEFDQDNIVLRYNVVVRVSFPVTNVVCIVVCNYSPAHTFT